MSRTALLTSALLAATAARADIAPPNTFACHDKGAGSACTTDDGQAGVCTEQMVSRPDYSSGLPPKSKQVKMMFCVATAPSVARAPFPGWATGAAFAVLLAMLGVSALRRRRAPAPGVGALLRMRRGGPAA